MIRMKFEIALAYEVMGAPGDFVFNIHAAQTYHQHVVAENLSIGGHSSPLVYTDPNCGARFMRLQVEPGPFSVHYDAIVDIDHHLEPTENLAEMPVSQLPSNVLPYIYPSRYCQSDRLLKFAAREFGTMRQGYGRVLAIQDWVRSHTTFTSSSTNSSTSALDTITEGVGVCRDFAHLMIALCRALNIPARFVTGIDYGADPAMGPTDFHAYVEVFLGMRWYLFDPTGVSPTMGLVRIGTGRDAADAAFATIFGAVQSSAPMISIHAVVEESRGLNAPEVGYAAVSTSSA